MGYCLYSFVACSRLSYRYHDQFMQCISAVNGQLPFPDSRRCMHSLIVHDDTVGLGYI